MRVLLQRVSRAKVSIQQTEKVSIVSGVLIFVAFCNEDSIDDIKWMIGKILNLRIFNDTDDKMNNSLLQKTGDVLIVSQFTLFANIKKGNRPSWNKAAPTKEAKLLYNNFIREFKLLYNSNKIQTGLFGQNMQVELINDGPVTIFMDSKLDRK